MARLKKQILGKVSGGFGDIVFRNTKRTNYIAARPVSFTVPQDDAAISRRSRFAMAGKFAAMVNSIPDLRTFWQGQAPMNTNLFNFLVKVNYPLVNPESLSEITALTPPLGWTVKVDTIDVSESDIQVNFQSLGLRNGINTEVEKEVRLYGIISLSNPNEPHLHRSVLIPIQSDKAQLSLTDNLSFDIPLTDQIAEVIGKYQNKIILFALVTYDNEGNPVSYSKTIIGR
jgi:hypothetical protein